MMEYSMTGNTSRVQRNSVVSAKESFVMTPDFGPTMRWIARCVLFIVSFVWYSPHVYATFEKATEKPAVNQIENYYPLGAELEHLRAKLIKQSHDVSQYLVRGQHQPLKSVRQPLALDITNIETIQELDKAHRDQLAATLVHLEDSQQADHIIARQKQNNHAYEQHMDLLLDTIPALQTLSESKEQSQLLQQQAMLDVALELLNTPFSRPHESYSNDLDFIGAPARDIYSAQSQINGLLGADAGNYTTTDSATLATQAIVDKVTELGSDPLTLYNWVHDTVRWIPSYGVMQGADYTLQSEQGNAFDTSSLLISLLRAAGHEARYRYGIVHVPVDEMRNWVGNVKNAAAVSNLMSQGGIPQTQISYGGAIEEFRFEHVWVEVKEGANWHALDPSFKQYTYTDGMDLESAVSFDAEGLLTQLQNSSSSNESEGWVQGVDASLIETELSNYQTQLENHLTNNAPDATLGDVLGLQTIDSSAAVSLPDAMPSYAVQMSRQVDQLPETLFHRFRFQVGSSISFDLGNSYSWGSEHFQLDELTTNLVGKDMALSFRPATPADEAVLESYLPEVVESVEDLPSTLLAGSINMIGELTIDGEVVYATPAVTLGESLKTRLGFIPPQQTYKFTENNIAVGQYQAIGLDMQGISPQQLEDLQAKLENTQTQLVADNTQSLTKHDVVGNILQAGVQGYMAMTYATDRISAQSAGVAYYRQPSYGTFSTEMEVSYSITGTPHEVTFSGVVMDIDRLNQNVEEKENCYEGWVAFNRASGMRNSAYEHQIPEQLFSTESEQAEGVSTAKALAIAMTQGQRIYTLTSVNAIQLNNITIDDGARAEIQSALNQGMEVTVHQAPITANGWQGSGYAILDSEYGVGAYKISGGGNGSSLSDEILIGVSALLGLVDGNLERIGQARPVWFSATLANLDKLSRYSAIASYLALAASLVNAINGGATGAAFYGQVALATFGLLSTMILVASAAAASGPILGAIYGGIIAAAIAKLMSEFSARYF